MIVRDEAEVLPVTLASLRAPADELVVVDTGSRDATREIARRAGARVLEEPWRDDFAAARNAALSAARGRWCLMLDADEPVEVETWPALATFLAAGECALGRVRVVSETPDGRVHETITRLCRNDGRARYEGRIHEQLVAPGRSGDTGLVCWHQGYTEEALLSKDKIARNVRLLRIALEDAPDDAYLRFQLGRTLWRAGGAGREEALEQLGAALAAAPASAPWAAGALRDLGHALREAGRAAEALALTGRGRAAHPDFTDLAFLEGLLHLDLGDAAAMLRAFETCLALGETRRYTSVEGVGSYRAHHNLGLFRELSGDPARARAHYEAALAVAPDFAPSRERLASCEPLASCERLAGLPRAASAARSAR